MFQPSRPVTLDRCPPPAFVQAGGALPPRMDLSVDVPQPAPDIVPLPPSPHPGPPTEPVPPEIKEPPMPGHVPVGDPLPPDVLPSTPLQ